MKKALLLASMTLFAILETFAATFTDALGMMGEIEACKAEITADGRVSLEERKRINALYKEFEALTFSASSKNGELGFAISEYDIDRNCWYMEFSGSYFGGALDFKRRERIPYSVVLEKRYVLPSEMTGHQRENYEISVSDYEERFQAGENILYAEISLKFTHWNGAAEYRIELQEISLYKIAKRKHLIYTILLNDKAFYNVGGGIEWRGEDDIIRDEFRTGRILRKETLAVIEHPAKHDSKGHSSGGRKSLMVILDIEFPNYRLDGYEAGTFDGIEGRLTWGFTRNFYGGVGFGVALDPGGSAADYIFGLCAGLNLNLGNFIRPYIEARSEIQTYGFLVFGAGLGVDIMFGRIALTTGFNFNRRYNMSHELSLFSLTTNSESVGKYYVGIGLAW